MCYFGIFVVNPMLTSIPSTSKKSFSNKIVKINMTISITTNGGLFTRYWLATNCSNLALSNMHCNRILTIPFFFQLLKEKSNSVCINLHVYRNESTLCSLCGTFFYFIEVHFFVSFSFWLFCLYHLFIIIITQVTFCFDLSEQFCTTFPVYNG